AATLLRHLAGGLGDRWGMGGDERLGREWLKRTRLAAGREAGLVEGLVDRQQPLRPLGGAGAGVVADAQGRGGRQERQGVPPPRAAPFSRGHSPRTPPRPLEPRRGPLVFVM